MICFYRILTFFSFPFFIAFTYLRRFIGKEDKVRFKEKISAKENYFPKNKKVFWIHAASVGEVNSVIPLIQELLKKDNQIFILLTSTTLSSSQLLKKKKLELTNFQHRFFLFDLQYLVKKFLNHWRPDLIIFIDSEVWPNYLIEISRKKIPLILLNGRITMKTFKRWKIIPRFAKKLFSLYDLCLSSSRESQKNLIDLGAKNVKFFGNLKFCVSLSQKKSNDDLKSFFKNPNIWCAASTHPGEEEIILKTHNLLKQKGLEVITIIIPRHITRSKKISEICKNFNLTSQIIDNYNDISRDSEIIIVNSIGEITKYFYICKSIFMGKSFSKKLAKVSGQNPIEPAKCGCKIYHGPYVANFSEVYNFLNEKKFAFKVDNEVHLSKYLLNDFYNKNSLNNKDIEDLNYYGHQILNQTMQEILKLKNEI
tara:strand:+ start:3257 stop:4528 length:1272 start_codon:yes stop_codon:yes gene_type:complete